MRTAQCGSFAVRLHQRRSATALDFNEVTLSRLAPSRTWANWQSASLRTSSRQSASSSRLAAPRFSFASVFELLGDGLQLLHPLA
jgi:hypothetical protein